MPTIRRTMHISAPAEQVWAVVADLPSGGRRSPENTGGRWVGGASGPAVRARFKGANRQGARRWSTVAQVIRCVPGREFAFDVRAAGVHVAQWAYEVEATGEQTCSVTETWIDRRGRLLSRVGSLVTGVGDRQAYAATSMEHTLAALKTECEAAAAV